MVTFTGNKIELSVRETIAWATEFQFAGRTGAADRTGHGPGPTGKNMSEINGVEADDRMRYFPRAISKSRRDGVVVEASAIGYAYQS